MDTEGCRSRNVRRPEQGAVQATNQVLWFVASRCTHWKKSGTAPCDENNPSPTALGCLHRIEMYALEGGARGAHTAALQLPVALRRTTLVS